MRLSIFRPNRLFRLASLLALWALVFPALLPLVHPMATVAQASNGSIGTPVMDAASMPSNCPMLSINVNKTSDVPQKNKTQPTCPICQAFSTFAQSYLSSDTPTLVGAKTFAEVLQPPPHLLAFFKATPAAQPRAPPSLA